MTQNAGRIACPRCGANNFDTVSACWRCQAPLAGGMSAGSAPSSSASALSESASLNRSGKAAYPASRTGGDPGVARRAAIALALTLPFIGLPVGWVFMMIEDERKQAIGRVCAVWSCISLVLQLMLMFAAAQSLGPVLQAAVRIGAKAAQQNQSSDLPGGAP